MTPLEGKEPAMSRILVAAASKHGGTAEIAERIGERLRGAGLTTDVVLLDDDTVLPSCDAVILGSGVYAGHWLGEAKRFVEHHAVNLGRRPVWLFSSGPIGDPPKPDEDPVDVASIVNRIDVREHRLFAGRLEKRRLGFAERAIITALRAPEGDFRPWPEIDAWAETIAKELLAAGPVAAGRS
jgi:menaquinone-dependent protoporphyrinogen oxidase